jgi:Amt family ammonium transporter
MNDSIVNLSYALDTFYFLVSAALVMWMAAGFAMLEAGMVRSKNTVEILTKNLSLFAIATIMCFFIGYSTMYSTNPINSFIPSFSFLIGAENTASDVVASGGDTYYSKLSDFFFQSVFVATSMSIVSGAVAERMKLFSFLAFTVVFTALIYPIEGFWTWGGGFLKEAGFVDFAGSGIVHMAGASAALSAVFFLGSRQGKYGKNGSINPILGSNMPLAVLGVFILWLGWFGFNGGSELKLSNINEANSVAKVFVNTNLSACAGIIISLLLSKIWFKKADLSMVLNGALAGLVAITADPLSPSPVFAIFIGGVAGMIVMFSIVFLDTKLKIDDPVGALSVHGVVGIFGLLAVPLSNTEASFSSQLLGIVVIFTWVFVSSSVVWFALKKTMGIRVSKKEEFEGVDHSECGMSAYNDLHNN